MAKDYNASNIQILEGLDAVRTRPGMYIGSTGIRGLHHILWEIVDNGMDEVANGYGDTITVTIHSDGSASVEDNGRGIPVDIHPQMKVSGVEVVFTQLHAGGKFGNDNYTHSGGLHGVGASVTNALSRWLHVEVYKNNTIYEMDFESVEVNGKVKSGIVKNKLIDTKKATDKKGTKVTFFPDDRVFETIKFNIDTISKRLKELAFLNKGTHINLIDERVVSENGVWCKEYYYEGGISDYVRDLNETKNTAYPNPIYFSGNKDNVLVEIAVQHTDAYTESIFSYVNNIPTTEGGTHETGFKVGLTHVMNEWARKLKFIKEKDKLEGDDYREGMTAVISIKMQDVQFEGQTKTKLGNTEIRPIVENIVSTMLDEYFVQNTNVAEICIKKGVLAAKVREAARKEKEITRAKNSIDGFHTVGKLKSCTGKKAENNELFIVEGDSAGGTCSQARNRSFQAVLPLRGKPLNAEKKSLKQVLDNEEIRTLISALGAGIGKDFDVNDLKYHKVVILSDADQDGMHIRAILLTFFFRYMRELINQGHVYIGLPPLYRVAKRGEVEYAYDDVALEELKRRMGRGSLEIQRYKGLGEMNAEQLWNTTMDPNNRKLIQVTIEDAAMAEKLVSTLMGDAIEPRRNYITEHANFNKEDTFMNKAK